ncbi:MAG: hypothetical protein Q4G00_05875 [Clostridia bacterium]|nr:hypothetical protein [Clostridia bacterium]
MDDDDLKQISGGMRDTFCDADYFYREDRKGLCVSENRKNGVPKARDKSSDLVNISSIMCKVVANVLESNDFSSTHLQMMCKRLIDADQGNIEITGGGRR